MPQDQSRIGSSFLILLGLSALAIAEPALSVFGNSPGVFIFHNIDGYLSVLAYAIAVILIPPVAGILLWLFVRAISTSAATTALNAMAAGLVFIWAVQQLRWSLNVNSTLVLSCVAGGIALLFFIIFRKSHKLRSWCQILAFAPVLLVPNLFYQLHDYGVFVNLDESASATQKPSSNLPSVLFIILDEFPTVALFDKNSLIDPKAYPNISSLAGTANWYRHYSVMASQTYNSIPAILSGLNPKNASPTVKNFPNNLFTLLRETHNLVALESISKLCASAECNVVTGANNTRPQFRPLLSKTLDLLLKRVSLTQRAEVTFADYAEEIADKKPEKVKAKPDPIRIFDPAHQIELAKSRPARLERFVASFNPDLGPTLYFLHLQLPHSPWRFYPNGQMYSVPRTRTVISPYNENNWLTKIAEYRFIMQAQYTDSLIGEVFGTLRQQGMWEDMLVVVTSDHGRSFVRDTATRSLEDAFSHVGYVPLLIKMPGQKTTHVDDSNILSVDIVPTIAQALNLKLDWATDGFPIGDPRVEERGDEKFYFPMNTKKVSFPLKIKQQQSAFGSNTFPAVSSRWLSSNLTDSKPLAILNSKLRIEKYIGRVHPRVFNTWTKGQLAWTSLRYCVNRQVTGQQQG